MATEKRLIDANVLKKAFRTDKGANVFTYIICIVSTVNYGHQNGMKIV